MHTTFIRNFGIFYLNQFKNRVITPWNVPINYLESTNFIIQSGNRALFNMNDSDINFQGSNTILMFDILSGIFNVYDSFFETGKYNTKIIWAKNADIIMIINCSFTDDNDQFNVYQKNYRYIDYPPIFMENIENVYVSDSTFNYYDPDGLVMMINSSVTFRGNVFLLDISYKISTVLTDNVRGLIEIYDGVLHLISNTFGKNVINGSIPWL